MFIAELPQNTFFPDVQNHAPHKVDDNEEGLNEL